jgi:hypothetical protein
MDKELTALFGPEVLQECWRLPTAIRAGQARKVGKLAGMLTNVDTPKQQRVFIQAMPLADRVLLCRWLADREYASNCVGK